MYSKGLSESERKTRIKSTKVFAIVLITLRCSTEGQIARNELRRRGYVAGAGQLPGMWEKIEKER